MPRHPSAGELCLLDFLNMQVSKTESLNRIVKLVETFHDFSNLIRPAGDAEGNILTRTRTVFAQFEFELCTELSRLGATVVKSDEAGPLTLHDALDRISHQYRDALNGAITAHTRAMLIRQSEEIQKIEAEVFAFARAA